MDVKNQVPPIVECDKSFLRRLSFSTYRTQSVLWIFKFIWTNNLFCRTHHSEHFLFLEHVLKMHFYLSGNRRNSWKMSGYFHWSLRKSFTIGLKSHFSVTFSTKKLIFLPCMAKNQKNGHARAPRTLLTWLLSMKNRKKVWNKKLVRNTNRQGFHNF